MGKGGARNGTRFLFLRNKVYVELNLQNILKVGLRHTFTPGGGRKLEGPKKSSFFFG